MTKSKKQDMGQSDEIRPFLELCQVEQDGRVRYRASFVDDRIRKIFIALALDGRFPKIVNRQLILSNGNKVSVIGKKGDFGVWINIDVEGKEIIDVLFHYANVIKQMLE